MRIYNYPVHGQINAYQMELAEKEKLNLQFYASYRHDKELFVLPIIEKHFEIIRYYAAGGSSKENFLIRFDGGVADAEFGKQFTVVDSFTNDHAKYQAFLTQFKTIFKEEQPLDGDQVELKFWYNSSNGPQSILRDITVPSWEEVVDNYSKETKTPLRELIEGFTPTEKTGQLILWHGKPGTGKTYALRALLKAWRKWCGGEYIMDPEALFGYSPGYLINMILSGSTEYYDDDDEDEVSKDSKWRLLILEDTGELLSESAKERSGQGLSRLLNLVDGLIGQGLKVLVLITTNEEIEKLHPAVSREGRCLASIKFEPFSANEAEEWAKENGLEADLQDKPYTLAELYSKTKTNKPIHTDLNKIKPKIGFAPIRR